MLTCGKVCHAEVKIQGEAEGREARFCAKSFRGFPKGNGNQPGQAAPLRATSYALRSRQVGRKTEVRSQRLRSGCRGLGQKLLVPFRPQDFHLSVKREEPRTDALIFLNDAGYGSGDGALADETLKLFIGAQAQHFFAATGRVSFPEVEENDVEEALEFKRRLG